MAVLMDPTGDQLQDTHSETMRMQVFADCLEKERFRRLVRLIRETQSVPGLVFLLRGGNCGSYQ